MTFTAQTLKRLNALALPPETVEQILEIFEEAKTVKKKGGAVDRAARGTRLAADWTLPPEWYQHAIQQGLNQREIGREAERFKDYWLQVAGAKGIKLDWFATWRTWIGRTTERLGRQPLPPANAPAGAGGPSREEWASILRVYLRTNSWHPDNGPAPGRLNCRAPADLIEQILGRRK